MNLDIRELTSSLSSYSSATNQAVNMMADAVRPIGYRHCTPIMGQEKKPLMRPVFCNLQETGHLISVEF